MLVFTEQLSSKENPVFTQRTLLEVEPLLAPLTVAALATVPALLLILSGAFILRRKRKRFVRGVALFSLLAIPIGTAIGIWTLVELGRTDDSYWTGGPPGCL
jgi:ABC-type spermidine/putrescine transport system permease subunit II